MRQEMRMERIAHGVVVVVVAAAAAVGGQLADA